jgi:hypothetical protein
MTTPELIYSQFVFDYLSNQNKGTYDIQPITYSDKRRIFVESIPNNTPIVGFKTIDGRDI